MFRDRIQPENLTGEYLHSKKECAIKQIKWPLLYHPTITLENLRRELIEKNDFLVKKREYYQQQRKANDDQWKKLEVDEESLRANFLEFDKFIRDNAGKKSRAERKIKDDRDFRIKTEGNIEDLSQKIAELKSAKAELDRQVNEHRIYQNFLDKVIDLSMQDANPYRNREYIINSYVTLVETRQELAIKQGNALDLLENAKEELLHIMEVNHDKIVGLSNRVADLQERYEDIREVSRLWEKVVEQVKDQIIERESELDYTWDSIQQSYRKMCHMKNIDHTKAETAEEKLIFIKNSMGQLETMRGTIMRILAKQKNK